MGSFKSLKIARVLMIGAAVVADNDNYYVTHFQRNAYSMDLTIHHPQSRSPPAHVLNLAIELCADILGLDDNE